LKDSINFNWKRLHAFYLFSLCLYIILIAIFSNIFSLKNILFTSYSPSNEILEKELIGSSIHLVDTESVLSVYLEDPNIEYVAINKLYPDTLEVIVNKYETLALVVDYRAANPKYSKLYKNSKLVSIEQTERISFGDSFNSVSVINGPLDRSVYGEFVNYFLLLKGADDSVVTNFTLDGNSLLGTVNSIEVDFTEPENLGKKASAVYQRMKEPCPSMTYSVDIDEITGEVIVVCNT
tara:strand:- start:295 stop:1002 length:708 start_codon:yes stop_codon:yes gene_type:complete